MITLEQVKNHPDVQVCIKRANDFLGVIGYTEHGERHGNYVARSARKILQELGYDANTCELAAISGYIHDIGNVVSRHSHPEHSAYLANQFLKELNMPVEDRVLVMSAVGNHDEGTCDIVSPVAAALIIADKSDVHRSRVRSTKEITFDIHDRVNYAVTKSELHIDVPKKAITLNLDIDKDISDMVEYFEIFTARMVACRRAAKLLGCTFEVKVNGSP
ncbi:MAG: phosphohydrolase [Candidatus Brocadia carolinensis]|uniref:Phosphohydrolase n=1 Tax=Candidatus Brocadia carolinensis TaxID=1004156 RepID=A0A1V4AT16_9BACT|nr:MAG: phosphohydrolase [Candidatus Brocadia caroliniensis]